MNSSIGSSRPTARSTARPANVGGAGRRRVGAVGGTESIISELVDASLEGNIVPEDQEKGLSQKELDEEINRVVTGNNPALPNDLAVYDFVSREFKSAPSTGDEHIVTHFSARGGYLHKNSEAAADQRQWEKQYRLSVEERQRERRAKAQAEGKVISETDLEDELQRNQFNFTERAVQFSAPALRTRVVSTSPPLTRSAKGEMTQWLLQDAYAMECEKLNQAAAVAAERSKSSSSAARSGEGEGGASSASASASSTEGSSAMSTFIPSTSDSASSALHKMMKLADASKGVMFGTSIIRVVKILERLAIANAEDEIYNDYRYWEDNVVFPESSFTFDVGAICIDWHPQIPFLLVAGFYDGTVRVIDVRRKEARKGAVFTSDLKSGKHQDPVWGVKWTPIDQEASAAGERSLSFHSTSSDGAVAHWSIAKSELTMEIITLLKLSGKGSGKGGGGKGGSGSGSGGETNTATASLESTASSSNSSSSSPAAAAAGDAASTEEEASPSAAGLASGSCFSFNPFDPTMYLVGTEEGLVHKCNTNYSGQYLGTYEGHNMAVYSVVWNAFHPRVFLSCSADWTVKMWDDTRSTPIMSFDLGTAVGDVQWAPFSSTIFAAVTDEGKVNVYDLIENKADQLCEQKIVKKAKCTRVAFSDRAPLILVGDSNGSVISLKLSPNLRHITPIPTVAVKKGETPPPPPSREEIEIRKMDTLLAASDAKITIITPIPGFAAAKGLGGDGAAAGATGAPSDGDADSARTD